MARATMGSFFEYRVTIGEHTYVAVVSLPRAGHPPEGPLERFVGHPIEDLTRACRQRGYPVSIHDASSSA